MATLTLTTPLRVGDLTTGITVDKLDLVSLAVNFQNPANPIVSVVLQHLVSGWTHTVTLTGSSAPLAGVRTAFPTLEKGLLTLLASSLPAGVIT